MYHFKIKYSVPLFLFMAMDLVSSTNEQMSMWQTTVNDFTAVAKDLGLDQANEPCCCKEFRKDDNTCMKKWRGGKLWREVEGAKIMILECNTVVDHQRSEVNGVCQLKSWFIILMIVIIIIICLIIFGCIACCALGYCCCCCRHKT